MGLEKEDIMALIAILQKGLTDEPKEKTKTTKADNKVVKPKTKKKRGKVEAESGVNKFVSMGFDRLHKEDCEIDRKLSQSPRTPRREKFEFIDVICRSCGKKEQINPALLYDSADRYKCNKCSTSPG